MSQNQSQELSKQNVQDSHVYLIKGDDYYTKQDYSNSMKMYDIAIKLNPYYYQAYINKGKLLNTLKRYEEAHQMFVKAFQLNPQDNQLYLNRGNSYFQIGEYERAVKLYDNAIKLNPQNAERYLKRLLTKIIFQEDSFIALGKCLKEKKYEDAFKFYDLLAIIDQKMRCLKKGETLIALGKTEEAIQMFNEGIQNEYDEWEYSIRESFADKLYASGNIDDAIRFYKREGSFQPNSNLSNLFHLQEYMLLLNRRFKEADTLNCKKYFFDYINPWENHQGLYYILFEALISFEQGIFNKSHSKNHVGQQLIEYK